ncbi:MAG: TonB family protein [Deltaproteobacteria bacterium]
MMTQLVIYSAFIWAFAALFYGFILRNEKNFTYNRIFLLIALIMGLVLPVLNSWFQFFHDDNSSGIFRIQLPDVTIGFFTGEFDEIYLSNRTIVLVVYFSVMAFLLIRFMTSIFKIIKLYSNSRKEYYDKYTIVRAGNLPFSFFSIIFLKEGQTDERIIGHELVHVNQKHSFDIILLEILKIAFWFNPLIYLFSNYLKENHEFAADNKVIEVFPRKTYTEILISQLQSGMQFQITNNFFNSLIKNRIEMMYSSKKPNQWKYLLAIVFVAIMVFFTNSLQSQNAIKPDKSANNSKKAAAFDSVDEMPLFPGCENQKTKAEKEKCSFENLVKYIGENLKYPKSARENSIEGQVVSRFTISKKGKIENIEILKDINYGCGDEVRRILESMNNMPEKWTPGKNKGKKVPVFLTLPVIFKLSDKDNSGSTK